MNISITYMYFNTILSSPLYMHVFEIDGFFFNQSYMYELSPLFKLNWYCLCMCSSFQSNDLAFVSGVSFWSQHDQFLKFLFYLQPQKYQRHWKLWLETLKVYVWLHPHPSPVSRTRIFIWEIVPIYTKHVENKKIKICLLTL